MRFYSDERLGVFVDAANIDGTMSALGWEIDYSRFAQYFEKVGRLMCVRYYTCLTAVETKKKQVDWLAYNGFQPVTKMVKEMVDSQTGQYRRKGNMDVEIAVDMMLLSEGLDHLVLVSGDGDYRRLVEALQQKGKRVTVVSTSDVKVTSDELKKQADNFLEINSIRAEVERARAVAAQ